MADLHELSALDLAAAIRSGEVSAVDAVDAALARAERLGQQLGAFVTMTGDAARDQATAADAQRGRGVDLPPLLGVPTAIKDLNMTAGIATKLGSAAFADFVPDHDDAIVTLLRAAGTISLGKTNTPELGLPCYTEPDVAPPARSPWDPERSAGGSSGGAAAAVAAGIVPLAQASDGGGSIRIPASVCGLVGLKPSRGRVSGGPVDSGAWSGLSTDGMLTRTVRDSAAALDAVAHSQPGDRYVSPRPEMTFLDAAQREPGRLRIGRLTGNLLGAPVDPVCQEAADATCRLLESLGHDVEDLTLEAPADALLGFTILWVAGAAAVPVPEGREDLLRPLTRELRARGRDVSAAQLVQAMTKLDGLTRSLLAQSAHVDVVVSPTLAQLPALVGQLRDDAQPLADFGGQALYTPYTSVLNVTGQPSMSLPLQWHSRADGPDLPVGVMLTGKPYDEALLLSVGVQLEQAQPWAGRRPVVW